MSDYERFLERKRIIDHPSGIENGQAFNPKLFPFQREIVRWALRRGRAAIFADCGLGKTPMQLEVIERAIDLWTNPIRGNGSIRRQGLCV